MNLNRCPRNATFLRTTSQLSTQCWAISSKRVHALEKAYEDRDVRLTLIKVESECDLFRAEPCFQSILKRVGLAS